MTRPIAAGPMPTGCPADDDVTPTPTPTPTAAWPARADEVIATHALLPVGDYFPFFYSSAAAGQRYDAVAAAQIPACRDALDVVFESNTRNAATATFAFDSNHPLTRATQYVVVFPDDAGAREMYDTLASPVFQDTCLAAYATLQPADPDVGFMPWLGTPLPSPDIRPAGADESFTRAFLEGDTWYVTTVRVGRLVSVITSLHLSSGDILMSDDDIRGIADRMVARARASLAGT
jgi:hypothetical protein